MDRLVADHAFVADLDADRIEKDKRVNRIERPLLPGGDLVEHGVRDRADQIGRHLDPVKLLQVPRDLRVLMPRAYIDTIFSSNPGKRR